MTKKLLMVFAVIFCMLIFASCGLEKVDEEQLKEDFIELDEVQDCYSSKYAKSGDYELKSINISKEQFNKDDKEDLIYCEAVVANDYFEVTLDAEIIYNYYDQGGWVLDEINLDDIEPKPIKAPDANEVYDKLSEGIYHDSITSYYNNKSHSLTFSKLQLIDSEMCDGKAILAYVIDDDIGDKVYGAKLNIEYIDSAYTIEGHINLIFVDDEWYFEYEAYESEGEKCRNEERVIRIDSYSLNLDDMVGCFKSDYFALKVYSIKNGEIRYGLLWLGEEELDDYFNVNFGYNLVSSFEEFSCDFVMGEIYPYPSMPTTGVNIKMSYDSTKKCWTAYTLGDIYPTDVFDDLYELK